jgi:hypothetical protein
VGTQLAAQQLAPATRHRCGLLLVEPPVFLLTCQYLPFSTTSPLLQPIEHPCSMLGLGLQYHH